MSIIKRQTGNDNSLKFHNFANKDKSPLNSWANLETFDRWMRYWSKRQTNTSFVWDLNAVIVLIVVIRTREI
jgi:hypothetical protein